MLLIQLTSLVKSYVIISNYFIGLFFFILLLSEAYFLDDMVLLKFREIIS